MVDRWMGLEVVLSWAAAGGRMLTPGKMGRDRGGGGDDGGRDRVGRCGCYVDRGGVEETLNIRYQENAPNVKGNEPHWLFDIDSLTITMNYVPVVARNQTNGIAGSKENLVAGQDDKKKELEQKYILIPICTTDPLISQGTKDSVVDARKKAPESNESEALDNGGKNDQVPRSEVEILLQQERQTENINSTNSFNTVSSPVITVGSSFVNTASQTPINVAGPSANDTGIFGNAYNDDVLEEEVDMNNVDSSYTIPEVTNFLKDHPQDQVIGIDLPKDKWAIGTKWVYKNKDEKGIVIKNIARLVAQGHTQEKGIDYDEVFAPVERIEAIRLFLAYASFKDFVVYQMDVKSAFLYRRIEEEVYVCQPPGFEDLNFLDKVYKVEKALYELHQAPRACQDKYMAEVLKKFDFVNMKIASTPMESNKPLIRDEEAEDVDVHLYK
nr:retrovirus-related Pol polyprotein from transposon TNT 1-94 [Tanacetum cinerariifolium]